MVREGWVCRRINGQTLKGEMSMFKVKQTLMVLFGAFTVLFSAKIAFAAQPTMGSNACEGAIPLKQLVRVEVRKDDLSDCPRRVRTPYLCALHRADLAHRSLSHAMRTTIADLGNGTCGRVNLRGVLIWTEDRASLEGKKFVDLGTELPSGNLRFGAWKTNVLYLAPVSGEELLASCTSDLADCNAQLVKTAVKCPEPECPKAESPTFIPQVEKGPTGLTRDPNNPVSREELQTYAREQDAIEEEQSAIERAQLAITKELKRFNDLVVFGDKIAECKTKGLLLYSTAKKDCLTTVDLNAMLNRHAQQQLAASYAMVDSLRVALRKSRSCLGRWRWSSDTDGWCDTSNSMW
ncbi:hypothetical protein A3B21_00980 [Candidatus Uhrbacteria bacterium RIFCSPLOWO2_01_FULL_47_24]|uniref:Uncharacterized protein n=1 Tax=Candidatus Uhrbacteria bacterium RIFCSPLOWO2_01_FULL_47_24 TaxID=1802401 RepID=A0A1F7UNW7_9BACT|nr:MAG: hypothetical protein A3D58_01145 [Candidatus Uhrbacteria bacterium RIFCSPHIGHO2_02_FULL_46_47]OGL76641.1 MAG: hypothetical protein A3F52_03670 [Candidatus Uhrbacteria bacterium RIFCSPHIGHO2_12_FULL_47_11]OGL79966.1 MAG: hypothetical protein A3B21_00980 [Candidatus Uhrbacteria bacterium RIFCSPLOWO2_01_FULL_47_24]OGL84346.1 MAG: hypothetical protein A3J03_00450 [Candidatus Uhrbacteria bacterium RIFCSPLOWO2_02_FULL_46_25]OGL92004.1 MAG: hypothetical protein A3H11_01595 [Candidatus Uhrbacte